MTQGVAVVTRSTGVVGRAIALQLADDGFDIALSADAGQQSALSDLEREIQYKGVRCQTYVCDLLQEASIKSLINGVTRDLGGLDVMSINSFDVTLGIAPLTETSVVEWDKTFAANTRPAFLCYKYAAEQIMKQNRGGRLIMTMPPYLEGGSNGVGSYYLNVSALNASICAVRGLTQAAALELGRHNITVNMVPFGPLDATNDGPYGHQPAIENYMKIGSQSNISKNVQNIRETVAGLTPLPQKNATGQDVSRVVSLLASNQNHFMTGQAINVTGGLFMT